MNKIKIIIGLVLCGLLVTARGGIPDVRALSEAPESKSLKECYKDYPLFEPKEGQDYLPFGKKEDLPMLTSALKFRQEFENTRKKYQGFVQCVFDGASDEILDHPDIVSLWVASDSCIDPKTLAETNASTSTDALLPALMLAYNEYGNRMKLLHERFTDELQGGAGQTAIRDLTERQQALARMGDLVVTELQNSKATLSVALAKLVELRQTFVMHVHFQCMVVNLRQYNTLLAGLRSVVESLPAHLIDASSIKK